MPGPEEFFFEHETARPNVQTSFDGTGLGFQQLPRDLANVNAWKTMFDPYIINHVANAQHAHFAP